MIYLGCPHLLDIPFLILQKKNSRTKNYKVMNGIFFAFAVIVLLANLAGGYVESMSNEKVKK